MESLFRCRWKMPEEIPEDICQKLHLSEFDKEVGNIYKVQIPTIYLL